MVAATAERWIYRFRPRPSALMRLFCFPYAGGGTVTFRVWPDALPEQVEVCAILLPGRETRLREPPFTQLPPLVEALSQAIIPYLDKPFALFGHSLGALIAFELARHLRRHGKRRPSHLFVSGHRAPQLGLCQAHIHTLPDAAFFEELRRFNGTPKEILEHNELMRLLLPMLKADFSIYERYVYQSDAPLDCPISAYGGREDPEVSEEDLRAWGAQTRGALKLQLFSGDHFFVESARHEVLRAVREALEAILVTRTRSTTP